MERKIGEIIEIKGKKYKCIVGKACADCIFDFKDPDGAYFCSEHADIIGACAGIARKDRTGVIFIEVEE